VYSRANFFRATAPEYTLEYMKSIGSS